MCNCRNKDSLTPDSRGLARRFPRPDDAGLVALAASPDCTKPYDGRFRQATVYLVGWGTEHEAMFRRAERKQAIAAARAAKTSIDTAQARTLCHEDMVALLER